MAVISRSTLADLCMLRVEMPHCAMSGRGDLQKKKKDITQMNTTAGKKSKTNPTSGFFSNLTLQNNYDTLKHQSRIIN